MMKSSGSASALSITSGAPISGNSTSVSSGREPMNGRLRTSSMAYPKTSRTNTILTKLQFYWRHNMKAVLASAVFLIVLLIFTSDVIHDTAGPGSHSSSRSFLRAFRGDPTTGAERELHWGGAAHAGSFYPQDAFDKESSTDEKDVFHFAAVSDLDQLSAVEDASKPTFRSVLLPGLLIRDKSTNRYEIQLEYDNKRDLITFHNEAGRGAEFSELQIYQNRLMTFDDRTGDVFEIINNSDGTKSSCVPRFVITEGEGDTDKGMKWEWATVKDNKLYIGSMGKEYTKPDGSIANTNNLWIGAIDSTGFLERIDWQDKYAFVRKTLGAEAPGYIIMEAILWSDHLNKWLFLPRRISPESYDDVKDEKRGASKIVLVNDEFTEAKVVDIQLTEREDGLRGFSTFAFVPNTKDEHAIAIRTVEEDCAGDLSLCKQRSYFIVFNVLTGAILSDEIKMPDDQKFEGIEFTNIYSKASS